ncbi:MAG: ATP-binding cassette domain-containing protein, partial [Lachnospiraceae bacterium]|nr:ATP-binding cassette domain-containing protein [Lachnospiraceae bacterium]
MENGGKRQGAETILSMENITKIYSNGFIANKNVNFELLRGEIHALAGENGAGKSTLMKVLFGEEQCEEGRILFKGKEVKIDSPLSAIKMGIGMVHQHFMMVTIITDAESMLICLEQEKAGFWDKEEAIKRTKEVSLKYGLEIDPDARIRDLSVGLKQRVEILKALLRGADILILDEPTAVLTPQETVEIFEELKRLKELGHTVVFISHKLGEIKEICDRITIMRDGRTIGVRMVDEVSEQEISRLMIGRDVLLKTDKTEAKPGKAFLSISNLNYTDAAGQKILNDINMTVRKGEILGIAGIEGNGQNELSELVTGMKQNRAGQILIDGADISRKAVREIRELGVSHISQDRMTYGVVADA